MLGFFFVAPKTSFLAPAEPLVKWMTVGCFIVVDDADEEGKTEEEEVDALVEVTPLWADDDVVVAVDDDVVACSMTETASSICSMEIGAAVCFRCLAAWSFCVVDDVVVACCAVMTCIGLLLLQIIHLSCCF